MTIWAEDYRPYTMDDVIIPDSVKTQFETYIKEKEIPNLLLTSSQPGTGKTTTAMAICADIGVDRPLFINASSSNSIDDIRMTVTQYAKTVSLFGGASHKVVILDEADRLSANAQDALKALIEEVHTNCRFILTANRKGGIIDPLQSRCTQIEFRFGKEEEKKLVPKMFKRCCEILDTENVQYDRKVLANIVNQHFPDNRQLLIFLQAESKKGAIDEGTLARLNLANPEVLIDSMKAKKFNEVKEWVANNADRLGEGFYERLYAMMEKKVVDQSIPNLILILGDEQKYHSIVPSKFLHFTSMCTKIMMEVEFK